MTKTRSLMVVVELVPFALTPDGLSVLGLVADAARPGRAPRGEFVLPTAVFDLAELDHPLAAAHAAADALFVPGDWRAGALYFPTSWRYGDSPAPGGASLHELVFSVAVGMIFTVAPQRRYTDLACPHLQLAWLPWDTEQEAGEIALGDYQRPTHDIPTSRKVAQHALLTLRDELYRRPERLGSLFSDCPPAQREASLISLYGKQQLRRADARKLLAQIDTAKRAA